MKSLVAFSLFALLASAAQAANLTCTANDNGKGVLVHNLTNVPKEGERFQVVKGNYTYVGQVGNHNVIYLRVLDNSTEAAYESMAISDQNLYLDVRAYEKNGKYLIFQCSFN